jgi:hypothetical protein
MWHLLFAIVLTSLQLQGSAEGEIHLIPQGYSGHVFIVFRAATGEPSAFEDTARLYRIPQNGILLTQHPPNTGSGPAWKFFYVSADGQRMPIERISNIVIPEQRTDPTVEIFLWGRGRQQAGQLTCDVAFDHYFVGTKAQMLMSDRIEGLRRLSQFLLTQRVCG